MMKAEYIKGYMSGLMSDIDNMHGLLSKKQKDNIIYHFEYLLNILNNENSNKSKMIRILDSNKVINISNEIIEFLSKYDDEYAYASIISLYNRLKQTGVTKLYKPTNDVKED
jgi:hypothetical protein